MSLVGLVHRVLHLPATIEETKHNRKIMLQANPQDPTIMKKLQHAINKMNELKIQGPRSKIFIFDMQ